MSILLIDIGNTRLKWALAPVDGNASSDFIAEGFSNVDSLNQMSSFTEFDQLSKNQIIKKIICSSVISDDKTLGLKKHCLTIMPQAAWFQINGTSAIQHLGSQYDHAQQLGADRRAMVLGAHQIFPNKHVLVIGAGTATTIDFITPTHHMGGWIFPGMRLMTDALNSRTAHLPHVSTDIEGSSLKMGTNTNDGIYQGILASHVGAIMMAQTFAKNHKMPLECVLVTGGNAKKLIECLKDFPSPLTIHHEDQLVLKGLLAWNTMGLVE